MILAYALVYSIACVYKYTHYLYDDIDLGIFVQAVNGLLHGSLDSSIRGGNWLGDHSSLNLFLIAPLYAVFRHPMTLLVLQSVILALGAVPVHALARRELNSHGAALALAAVYLLNPALGYTNLFEFHPEVLSTTALLFAIDGLRAGRLARTLWWSGLALLGKEDVALVVLGMSLYALTLRGEPKGAGESAAGMPSRRWRFAGALGLLGVVFLALNFLLIKPRFGETGADYALMYREWGGSLGEVVLNVIRHPLGALSALQATPGDAFDTGLKRLYWIHVFLPVGFLAVLSPTLLLPAAPIVLEHFLSWRYPQHAILNQYTALVTPFVIAAAVLGVRNLVRWSAGVPRVAVRAAALAVACAMTGHMMFGPFRAEPLYWSERVSPTDAGRAMNRERDRMFRRLPKEGGVVASAEFLARVATRDAHAMNHVLSGKQTFSLQDDPVPEGVTAALVYLGKRGDFTLVNEGTSGRWRNLIERNGLVPTDAAGDLLLLERAASDTIALCELTDGAPNSPVPVGYDERLRLLGFDVLQSSVLRGTVVPIQTYWQREADVDSMYMTEFVVVDSTTQVVSRQLRFLGYTMFPAHDWPLGATVRETYRLVLPDGLPSGTYGLGVRIWIFGKPMRPATPDVIAVQATGGFVPLGAFVLSR